MLVKYDEEYMLFELVEKMKGIKYVKFENMLFYELIIGSGGN